MIRGKLEPCSRCGKDTGSSCWARYGRPERYCWACAKLEQDADWLRWDAENARVLAQKGA